MRVSSCFSVYLWHYPVRERERERESERESERVRESQRERERERERILASTSIRERKKINFGFNKNAMTISKVFSIDSRLAMEMKN